MMRMKTAKREQKIISLLESRGEISIGELSSILGISESTLRKQLTLMQQKGWVIRTYGGVMSINLVPDETFESKMHKNIAEKRRIAELAKTLLHDGATIALASGTTVYCLGMLLDNLKQGVIYSNSMQTADYLSHCAGLEVHICSGIIRGQTGTIIGNEVGEYFHGLKQVDYAFIGCDAIDGNGEVFSDNLSVATAEKTILLSAKHRYILCDSSKIGKSAIAGITNLKDCDALITGAEVRGFADRYKTLTRVLYA